MAKARDVEAVADLDKWEPVRQEGPPTTRLRLQLPSVTASQQPSRGASIAASGGGGGGGGNDAAMRSMFRGGGGGGGGGGDGGGGGMGDNNGDMARARAAQAGNLFSPQRGSKNARRKNRGRLRADGQRQPSGSGSKSMADMRASARHEVGPATDDHAGGGGGGHMHRSRASTHSQSAAMLHTGRSQRSALPPQSSTRRHKGSFMDSMGRSGSMASIRSAARMSTARSQASYSGNSVASGLSHSTSASSIDRFMDTSRSGMSTRRMTGRKRFPRREHEVVIPDVKLRQTLPQTQQQVLDVQARVMNKVSTMASDKNAESHILVKLFRECKPDEFGLVSRNQFNKVVSDKFAVSSKEADMLFRLADARGTDEVRYDAFRSAFDRLDTNTVAPPPTRRMVAVPANSARMHVDHVKVPPAKSLHDLNASEKQKYRDFNNIRKALNSNKHRVKQLFKTRQDGAGEYRVHTKLSYDKTSEVLRDLGVEGVSTRRLQQLLASRADAGDGVTYSQLAAQTRDYFADLDGVGPNADPQGQLQFRGQHFGRRKVGGGPASKVHHSTNDFLAHHDKPQARLDAAGTTAGAWEGFQPAGITPIAGGGGGGGGGTMRTLASSASHQDVAGVVPRTVPAQTDWNGVSAGEEWSQRWTQKTLEKGKPSRRKQYRIDETGPFSWKAPTLRLYPSELGLEHSVTGRRRTQRSGAGGGSSTARSRAPFAVGENWA